MITAPESCPLIAGVCAAAATIGCSSTRGTLTASSCWCQPIITSLRSVSRRISPGAWRLPPISRLAPHATYLRFQASWTLHPPIFELGTPDARPTPKQRDFISLNSDRFYFDILDFELNWSILYQTLSVEKSLKICYICSFILIAFPLLKVIYWVKGGQIHSWINCYFIKKLQDVVTKTSVLLNNYSDRQFKSM